MITFGIETFNKNSQKIINKHINIEQVKKTFYLLNKNNILIWAHFITFPWESKKDQINKIKFSKKYKVDFIQIYPLYLFPDTTLWKTKSNYIKKDINNFNIRLLYLRFYLLNFNIYRFLKIVKSLQLYKFKNLFLLIKSLIKKETFE